MISCFSSTGGNDEGSQGNQFSVGHFLPTHLSHHDREALLVDPEVQ